jgi:hypothetical protein
METSIENDDLALPEGFSADGGSEAKFEYRKLKRADDEIFERLLPAWGSLLGRFGLGVYSKLHYGWKVRDPKNPTKISNRPFLCVEERQGKMVTKECPACNLMKTYQDKKTAIMQAEAEKLSAVRAKATEKGLNEDQLNKGLAKVIEEFKQQKVDVAKWLSDHNADGKVRLHTINKSGKLGVLSLPYGTVKKLIKEKTDIETRDYPASIAKGRKVKVQANGMCGVFFKITRKGNASKDSDSVVVNRIVNDDGSEMVDFHKITADFLLYAEKALPDLVQMMEDTRISSEKIQQLVDHCVACGGSCDPDEVESIMGPRPSNKTASKPAPVKAPEVKVSEPVKAEPVVEVKPDIKSEVKAEPAKEPEKASQNMADASDDEFDDLFK